MNDTLTDNIAKMMQRYSFLLAVLIHCLFLYSLIFVWIAQPKEEKKAGTVIPPSVQSYVYKEKAKPPMKQELALEKAAQKEMPQTKIKQTQTVPSSNAEIKNQQKEVMPEVRRVDQFNVVNLSKKTDPVHLIGDKNVDVPLLTLLGKAFTARLVYPKIAVDFNVGGLVLVGFTIHPDGNITDAQLVRTSGAGVLDEEAMRALHAISPVSNVHAYLTEPKFMVVGILFGNQVKRSY